MVTRMATAVRRALENWRWAVARLGRVPAPAWIPIYLLVVLAFGFVYDQLPPRSFYHSTAMYEYEYLTPEADRLLVDVRREMERDFRQRYGGLQAKVDGWDVDFEQVRVTGLYVGRFPDEFSLRAAFSSTYNTGDQGPALLRMTSMITVPVNSKIRIGDVIYSFVDVGEYSRINMEGHLSPDAKALLPFQFEWPAAGSGTILPLSVDLYSRIVAFGQGFRGFPSGVGGQFWRMLYLSAGVATSSALGDVVPLTTRARAWVAVEAVIAVIILGLFVNSLVQDAAEARRKPR